MRFPDQRKCCIRCGVSAEGPPSNVQRRCPQGCGVRTFEGSDQHHEWVMFPPDCGVSSAPTATPSLTRDLQCIAAAQPQALGTWYRASTELGKGHVLRRAQSQAPSRSTCIVKFLVQESSIACSFFDTSSTVHSIYQPLHAGLAVIGTYHKACRPSEQPQESMKFCHSRAK